MALPRRRKWMLWCLALYWPALFVLTHIPMPTSLQGAHISDKLLHFIAYFLLVFLFWGTIKPYERVCWRRATAWWVLVVVVWYGVTDEWLQGFVKGRTVDRGDFFADAGAAVSGLVLLTFVSFWPALLGVGAVAIFTLFVLAQGDFASLLPAPPVALPALAFGMYALLWILYLAKRRRDRWAPGVSPWRMIGPGPGELLRWGLYAVSLPLGLLGAVKLGTLVSGKGFAFTDMGAAALAVGLCVGLAGFRGSASCPTRCLRF